MQDRRHLAAFHDTGKAEAFVDRRIPGAGAQLGRQVPGFPGDLQRSQRLQRVDARRGTASRLESGTAPVAPAVPADVTVECADDVPAPVDLTATANCEIGRAAGREGG